MSQSKFYFFFPFLKSLVKLGMQTAGSLYFGVVGLALGAGAGWCLHYFSEGFVYSWQFCAVSGGLAGALLGSLLAPVYFKPLGAASDTMVWVRSVSASTTLAFFSLPAAGFAAVFIRGVRTEHSIFSSLMAGFKQGMSNFHWMERPQGWLIGALVVLSGIGFRSLLDALDGTEGKTFSK